MSTARMEKLGRKVPVFDLIKNRTEKEEGARKGKNQMERWPKLANTLDKLFYFTTSACFIH